MMTTRRDHYLDAMLRHLGAAYYESLHGRASQYDVTRALDTVEEHLKERPAGPATEPLHGLAAAHPAGGPRRDRWASKVSDVMTTSVVTVDRITSYQEIVRLLVEHKIGGVPVLQMGRTVAGVITESDLLAAEDKARQARLHALSARRPRLRKPRLTSLTAGALMTAPAITVNPGTTIQGAARLMNTHHIRSLPVVDSTGKLVGVVSRRDVLSVLTRPDADIAGDVRQMLADLLLAEPEDVIVTVHDGVVTLSGPAESLSRRQQDLVAVALRLIWDHDGVVDVVNNLGKTTEAETA
jgi:CBS domain-containing protein